MYIFHSLDKRHVFTALLLFKEISLFLSRREIFLLTFLAAKLTIFALRKWFLTTLALCFVHN